MSGILNNGIETQMLSIDDLHQNQKEKIERRYETYNQILKKCHNRIKSTAALPNNLGCCFYNIPKYIYGIPLYDNKACILYIINSLIKNGFDVYYTHPNLLYISWIGKTNNNRYNNSNTKYITNEPEYKMIENYKPSGTLISNNNNNNNNFNNNSNNNNNFNNNFNNNNSKKINDIDKKLLNLLG